ncbi:MAG: hypothetical protein NXI32_25690 [bacterium]|nr:hypothetical protein [bacterium]
MLFQGLIDYFIAWLRTRRWRRLLLFTLPAAIAFFCLLGVVAYGWLLPENYIVETYLAQAEEEIDSADSDDDQAEAGGSENKDDEAEPADGDESSKSASNGQGEASKEIWGDVEQKEVSDTANLLLRRVLHEQEFNNRATFLVALDLSRRGRAATARQMMRKIAPRDEREPGFGAAYAWLAADLAQKEIGSAEEFDALVADLAKAVEWEGVSTALIELYARALFKRMEPQKAIEVLKRNLDDHPDLVVPLAEVALGAGEKAEFESAVRDAQPLFVQRIQEDKSSAGDYLKLARILQLQDKHDDAIRVADGGLKASQGLPTTEPQLILRQRLRRLISMSCVSKFEQTSKSSGSTDTTALRWLDQAVRADPSNPQAIQYTASIISEGGQPSAEMLEALQNSLSDGTATFVTHLLIANNFLASGQTEEAVPHLEMSLRRAPDNPIALNNLAIALISKKEPDAERALAMIDRALKFPEPSASMLDTKGQVLEALGDDNGAIICFEDAIRLENNKVSTRERLAAALERIGMADLAQRQKERIAAIRQELANPIPEAGEPDREPL